MKKISALTTLVLLLSIVGIANIQTSNGELSPSPEKPEDEQFFIHHTFWAFGGFFPICLFEATSGDYVQFTISSVNSDPDRPDDKYIIELIIGGTNHSTTVIYGTQFREIIRLNHSDTYNITSAKHPFYSSVIIDGEVTVHHHPIPLATNAPSPFAAPSLSPTQTPTASNSTYSKSSPSPAVPELSWLAIIPLLVTILFAPIIIWHRKNINQNKFKREDTQVISPPVCGSKSNPQ
jgi:hypothetical protein